MASLFIAAARSQHAATTKGRLKRGVFVSPKRVYLNAATTADNVTDMGNKTDHVVPERRMPRHDAVASYRAAVLAVELGAQIRRTRVKRRWSTEAFAEQIGMTPEELSSLEDGNEIPSLALMEHIAEMLAVELKVSLGR